MRRYHHILLTSDAFKLMVLKPWMRLDAMTALGMLARVLGMRDRWRAIRKAYGLKWSRETSCVHAVKHVELGAFGAECGITFGGFTSRKAKLFIQT
jgi:hypothetical protein